MAIRSSDGPLINAFVITPNDANNLPNTTSSIFANSTGTANVMFINQNTFISFNMTQGITYPFRIIKVASTGTSANLIGLL